MNEYPLPKHMNKKWLENNKRYKEGDNSVKEFLLKRGEQLYLERKRKKKYFLNYKTQDVCVTFYVLVVISNMFVVC